MDYLLELSEIADPPKKIWPKIERPKQTGPRKKLKIWEDKKTDQYLRKTIAVKYHKFNHEKQKYLRTNFTVVYCYIHKDKLVLKRIKASPFDGLDYQFKEKRKWNTNFSVLVYSNKDGRMSIFKGGEGFFKNYNLHNNVLQSFFSGFNKNKKSYSKRLKQCFKIFFRGQNINLDYKKIKDENDLDREIKDKIYPLAGIVGISQSPNWSSAFSSFFRTTDFKICLKNCFGNDGKQITKLVGEYLQKNKDFNLFYIGALLKNVVPLDYIQKILLCFSLGDHGKHGGFNYLDKKKVILVRRFLGNFDKTKILRWFRETNHDYDAKCFIFTFYFRDLISMYEQHPEIMNTLPRNLTFNEIHDYFAGESRKLRNKNEIFKYKNKDKEMDGLKVTDLEVKLPPDSYTLIDWGAKMNHCVGSYVHRVKAGDMIILGIYRNNELIYNISINKQRKIEQFLGKNNCNPDVNDKNIVEEALRENKFIKLYRPVLFVNDDNADEPVPAMIGGLNDVPF